MSWNHRIIQDIHGDFSVREVFYHEEYEQLPAEELKEKHVYGWTEIAVAAYGDTLEEIRTELERMLMATKDSVLLESELYRLNGYCPYCGSTETECLVHQDAEQERIYYCKEKSCNKGHWKNDTK